MSPEGADVPIVPMWTRAAAATAAAATEVLTCKPVIVVAIDAAVDTVAFFSLLSRECFNRSLVASQMRVQILFSGAFTLCSVSLLS